MSLGSGIVGAAAIAAVVYLVAMPDSAAGAAHRSCGLWAVIFLAFIYSAGSECERRRKGGTKP